LGKPWPSRDGEGNQQVRNRGQAVVEKLRMSVDIVAIQARWRDPSQL
jgi:hypothetical protein